MIFDLEEKRTKVPRAGQVCLEAGEHVAFSLRAWCMVGISKSRASPLDLRLLTHLVLASYLVSNYHRIRDKRQAQLG